MGFLRLLLRVPFYIFAIIWEACLYFALFLLVLIRAVLWLISPIIGDINWSTPKWYPKAQTLYHTIANSLSKRSTFIGSLIIIAIIGYFSANYAYHWYQNRPKPIDPAPIIVNHYSANYYEPSYSNSTLKIGFVNRTGASPAPLDMIGKTISEGITLSPQIDGQWRWHNNKMIEFKPTQPWPLGTQYTVKLESDKLFSENNLLQTNSSSYSFKTQDFSYSISREELYQDPINPSNKMAIFTVNFSHPIDKLVFERKISLALYEKNSNNRDKDTFIKQYDYTVTYNNDLTTAYIKSGQIGLPNQDGYMQLSIEKGITSSIGGTPSKSLNHSVLVVPSKFNLNINNFDVSLVEVNNQEMRQVLTVSFNYNVKASDIHKVIKVWQLPINPNKQYTERYYDELDRTYKTKINVDGRDLEKSTPIALKVIDTEQNYQNQISFEFKAEQKRQIYIEVEQPLVSDGGYYLSTPYHDVKTVPAYPYIMNFAASGSLLSLSGDKKIPIVSRNMSALKLQIGRVIPSQLQHLVAFNGNDFQWMNFGDLDSENFVEKYTVIKSISGTAESTKYTDVDISKYLTKDVEGNAIRGVFLVNLYGNTKDARNDDFNYYDSRFIIVTDIGIINKKSLDQSQDIFVQSIRTGQPIADAKVSVIGVNGVEITALYTDESGHVHFDPLSEYYQGIRPLFFVVEKGQDLSFLPISSYDRQLNFSRFDVGGIYETIDGGELRTHLFSDRGVYRPGDTFHIGMIVRAQDWSKSLNGIRLEADIYDPKSNQVKTESITLDKYGFEELSYKTDYSSPTGEWYINLYLKNPREDYRILLGSTSVVVREFEPDKTAVTLKLLPDIKEGWVHPDALSAQVEAKNLFGTPAQNRIVQSQLFLEPSAPYFKKYDKYAFYQNISRQQNSFNIAVEERITDENGLAHLDLPIGSFEGNYTAKLLTEVFEPDSGRSVAATATAFVSPNDYLIGSKADGRLDYIKKDSRRIINFIAVDSNLEPISLNELTLVKIEQKYLSVLVKQPSGVYKYESKRKDVVINESPFSIDKTSTNYTIENEDPGNFTLQIKNKNGHIIYQTAYSIAGTANVTRNLDRNAELVLKIDDNQYKAGDEIEVSITAPYIGSGIITIERDKVYAHKWFKTNTTSSVQKITVPAGIDGNAYINVQFIRDPSSDEIFMSPLSYAVAPFKISNDKFNDHIKLTTPDKIKPGQTLPITVETHTKQRVVIFAIDEGILQVSGYKLKNPLNEFIRKKALSVRTLQILDLILPEYSRLLNLSAPGGDSDEMTDELSAHLNPFKRKVDEPVAYWSGIIDVDGIKTVDYTVPDYFNGKIRVMAVSVGEQTMGSTQTVATVRNDFVISPNIPYFVAPNDEFEISVSIANNLDDIGDHAVPIQVTLKTTPQLTILDEAIRTITLASMKEGSLTFKLKATDTLGSGDLHFTASYNDKVVDRQVSTSVRPASQYRLKTTMGRMDGSQQSISDMRQMYAPYSQRQAAVSYSPFILSKGLATYLADYPHYCSEQIVSRAMPLLIDSKYPDFELVKNNSIQLDALFQTLQTRQNSEGAIGLWYSTYNVDPFITLYAVNFMLEAKEAGQSIPNRLLERANQYVAQIATSQRTDQYGLRLRAYASYLLTRQNQVTTSYLASIMADLNDSRSTWWQTDLTALYLASSYQMLKMDKEADKLFKPVWQSLSNAYNSAWWNHNYYDPLVMDSGKIYLITKHFSGYTKEIPAQALENLVLMLKQERYTTQSSAMTMLALDSYVSSINLGALTANDLTITSQDQQHKRQTIATLKGLLAKGEYDADVRTISFNNQTKLPAWYMVSEQGFDNTIQQKPITKGLEVYREFTDDNGNVINQVKLGDKVNVTIRIRSLSKEGATNLAIVDLLPGGFEVVQQPIKSSQDNDDEYDEYEGEDEEYYDDTDSHWLSPIAVGDYTWYPDYTDVREDRVIIYGSTDNNQIQTFKYQIKATNVGQYSVPPAYGEAMYDRDIQAVSQGGNNITVMPR